MDDFNSFRKKAEETILNGWQILTEQKDDESADKKMQKREIQLVNILMSGDTKDLEDDDPFNDLADRKMVLKGIRDERITNQYWERILEQIPGPIDDELYDGIFREMANDDHMRKILAATIGAKIEDYDLTTRNSVVKFAKQYPTPIRFDKEADSFLEGIRATNSNEIYQDYVDAMDDFKHAVYGEKQDYWDAAKALIKEAEAGTEPEDESKVIHAEALFRPGAESDEFQARSEVEPSDPEVEPSRLEVESEVEPGKPETAILEEEVVDAPRLSQDELSAWEKKLGGLVRDNGKLLVEDVDREIGKIESPLTTKTNEELLVELSGDEKKLQILAKASRKKMSEYKDMTTEDINEFKRRFDNPVKFDMISGITLNTIRRMVGDDTYHEYEKAMVEFKRDMYGKQQDYLDAMKNWQKKWYTRHDLNVRPLGPEPNALSS